MLTQTNLAVPTDQFFDSNLNSLDPDNAKDLFVRVREFLYEVRLSADFARSQLAGRELVGALGKEVVVVLVSLGATLAQAVSTAKVSAGNMQVIGQLAGMVDTTRGGALPVCLLTRIFRAYNARIIGILWGSPLHY